MAKARTVVGMILFWAGLSGLGAQTPEASGPPKDAYPVQLSSKLDVSSQAELGKRMNAAFAEGVAHPAGVHNCSELLGRARYRIFAGAIGPDAQARRSTLANCLIFQKLRGAAASRSSYAADLKWDERVMPLLPPELAINVSSESVRAAKAASARGRKWVDLDRDATVTVSGPDQLLVKGNGFTERLILWGRGDLDQDGREDLLVQTLDTLTEGTYRNTRLFVLTRKSPTAPLSVVKQLL